jgi:purine-cytosine permease-like protein
VGRSHLQRGIPRLRGTDHLVGLSFYQAVGIILIGNLAYLAVGAASIQGPKTGTTAMVIGRAVFGRKGNNVPSFFNWITQEGYEVLGLVLVVLLTTSMFEKAGVSVGNPLKIGILAGAVLIQFVLPFLGHDAIEKTLRYLSYIFIPVFIVMAVLVIPHVKIAALHQHASWQLLTSALIVIVSAGGLGWTENANDYSRYIPATTSKAKIFGAATLGGMIPSILLELLGAAAFTVSPKVTAITGVPSSFATWFFWPFVILALPQLFSIGTMDLYSAGMTLQALGVRLKRTMTIVVNMAIAAAVALLVILKGNLYNDLSGFLNYTLVWLAPWFAIYFTDYLLRRGRYDSKALVAEEGGLYWRNGGFNVKALVALIVAMVGGVMWINASSYVPSYIGPISKATGGSDFSWVVAMVLGAGIYYVLQARDVRHEVTMTTDRVEVEAKVPAAA